jgi:D-xylose transport system substrate-binding protein
MRIHLRKLFVSGSFLAIAALAAAGCGSSGGGGSGPTIALLLPENQTPRYEAADKPDFEAAVSKACPDCNVIYSNAEGKITDQQSQAESALTQGADVLVVDAVDATSAAAIVTKANAQNVPVVSYDRLILKAPVDYYVSFDNERVGQLQGQSLAAKLKQMGKPTGPIVQINGDPADPNAALFAKGAESAFSAAGVQVAKKYDTPGWLSSNAQNEMQQAITALGNNGFAGVYGANDDMAGGAIAAMKSAGVNPGDRPSTGQDATVAGIQRILAGEQYMTVYKAVEPEASAAAQLAVALAQGKKPDPGKIAKSLGNGGQSQTTNNGSTDVPSIIFTPVAVTKDNVKSTVIADGYDTPAQVCTGPYKADCKKAGISG